MTKLFLSSFCFLIFFSGIAQIKISDASTKKPISYATISFGNGNGIFADDEGIFFFTEKLYPDIDSLFISALGYRNLKIGTQNLPKDLFLQPNIDQLEEIVINSKPRRKYKKQELKPYLDDNYYNCWLPTIESEIAIFFPNTNKQLKKITAVTFPIALESKDWKKRKKSNSDKKKFSTLFKVKFYANEKGLPGSNLTYETIVFRATQNDGDFYELNIDDYDIYIPDDGLFISLQVLGYTDKSGKLLPNKKYKEIKDRGGKTIKIPTNFRPLLPFTDKIDLYNTYIKRVFINGNNWIQFKKENNFKSSLLDKGLYNYGIGLKLNVYKSE